MKEKLRERSLKVSGLKRELVDRLLEADGLLEPDAQAHMAPQITGPRQTYQALTVVLLKEKLRERSLKVSGLKRELVDRLLEADARVLEMV